MNKSGYNLQRILAKLLFHNFSDINFSPTPITLSTASLNQGSRATEASGGGDAIVKPFDHSRFRLRVAYIESVISGVKTFYEVSIVASSLLAQSLDRSIEMVPFV